MKRKISHSSFTHQELKNASDAAVRGYTTMRDKYSRPSRCDRFLEKRLNVFFNGPNRVVYVVGQILTFTVKAGRYRVYALNLPYKYKSSGDGFVGVGNATKEYRFFDTEDEAKLHRAMRDIPETQVKTLDIGHLAHKENKSHLSLIQGRRANLAIIDDYA